MASPTVPLVVQSNLRLFTAADLAVLPSDLPSGAVDYELENGRLIVMVPPGHLHGVVQLRIGSELLMRGERAGHGRAITEVGVVLSRNPDTVLGPDVVFIGKAKLPVRESPEGYLETIPDLVVEVHSRNDTLAFVADKVAAYLSAGVGIVWVADPEARTITVHRAASQPCVYGESNTLTLAEFIPDFRLNLADIYRV